MLSGIWLIGYEHEFGCYRHPKTAVNGEVVWQYSLVAPRGVFRAQVFAVGATVALSSVEVK
jgi:hypothetical protein